MLTIELSWLKIIGLLIGQIILFLIAIITTVWKVSQYFYNRQIETMRHTIELLDKKASMVDVIEKYHETQAKMLKDEYDKAISENNQQRAKEIKILQGQNESLSKQVTDLTIQVENYKKNARKAGVLAGDESLSYILDLLPYFSPERRSILQLFVKHFYLQQSREEKHLTEPEGKEFADK